MSKNSPFTPLLLRNYHGFTTPFYPSHFPGMVIGSLPPFTHPTSQGWSPVHSPLLPIPLPRDGHGFTTPFYPSHFPGMVTGSLPLLPIPLPRDGHGFTPLHWATRYGRTKVVDMLCTRAAKVNASNMGGDAPLHIAVSFGQQEILYKVDVQCTGVHWSTGEIWRVNFILLTFLHILFPGIKDFVDYSYESNYLIKNFLD